MLKLRLYNTAQKNLSKIKKSNFQDIELILAKIEELKQNPLPNGIKKLQGYDGLFRAKVKDYRIVYEFNQETLLVIMIETRERVYKLLKRLFK